jgi:hypothetical protein
MAILLLMAWRVACDSLTVLKCAIQESDSIKKPQQQRIKEREEDLSRKKAKEGRKMETSTMNSFLRFFLPFCG